jgi:hypothetical protein
MTVSNPMVTLFKEQLEAECAQISKTHALTDRGHWLIYWYFKRLHNFTNAEIDEVFCDGGGDLGIDAIWIDDNEFVHFYQFKNPIDASKGIPGGDVDKVISGLKLILGRKHDKIANPELKGRIEDIYQTVVAGYRLHLVSSGKGIQRESELKLQVLSTDLSGPSSTIFAWNIEELEQLQEKFYQQNLPAVKESVYLKSTTPHMARSGVADSYFFHVDGKILASLYEKYGEGLLQRNIRVDQRDTPTNRSIEATCEGNDSANFLHFNNGVTFLCESADWDAFKMMLTLEKAQVVNGGQTIRALHRANTKGSLKGDVLVPARIITSSGEKDFANNVAVNQNNQNQVRTGFLRSNDPRVVQLDHALAALGWFLERREGELKISTADEKDSIERRIGRPLEGRVIHLKEGAQAYTATFYGEPELAKKNIKKVFLGVEDGGYFERIFSPDMTAEKLIIAHELKTIVDNFVAEFMTARKKLHGGANVKAAYVPLLGPALAENHSDVIHQVMPQCSLFVCATIFADMVTIGGLDPSKVVEEFKTKSDKLIREHVLHLIDFAHHNKAKADKSWPTLLKSNAFFHHVISYLQGIRNNQKSKPVPPTKKQK